MGQITLAGNPPIDVHLRRSARARRLSLRMSQLDGRVTLTLPSGVSEAEGVSFLRAKETWLRGHLSQRVADVVVAPGVSVPVEGVPRVVRVGQGRAVRLDGPDLVVPGDPDRTAARLQGWLKTLARDRLAAASQTYATRLGRPYTRLTLRDTRSRWGSCTAAGGLMYSWRLVMAPPEVLDYVAAHEVAHLAEMNHSPAFWRVVENLYGDWHPQRQWLHREGAGLHRYRF